MGYRFDNSDVDIKCVLNQFFSISGNCACGYVNSAAAQLINFFQLFQNYMKRVSEIRAIVTVQNIVIRVKQHQLGRCASGVNS